jgi:hypothetical protein
MKKIGFKSLLPLFLILLTAMACDKENLNSLDEMGSDNLKSAIASDDTAITIYPDLVLQDTILETNACITQ